jgi:GT2 family glycosyltransferase
VHPILTHWFRAANDGIRYGVRVAIVIVTYNGRKYVEELFASLRAHTDLAEVVTIVVDNASSDGTLAAVEAEAARTPNVVLLPQRENTGFTGGNNVGLAEARRHGVEFAFLLNHDTVLTPGWLEPLIEIMNTRSNVAAAQPLLVLHDEPDLVNTAGNQLQFCCFGFCGDYRRPVAELRRELDGGAARSVPYATGAALLLRMAALDRVGDFDPLLFLYHEDLDLQVRLRQAGYDCVLVPSSVVRHKYTASFSAAKYVWIERNRIMVLIKDWPLNLLVAAAPALAAAELAVLAFAARGGWLWPLARGYADVARHLGTLLAARRRVQRARSAEATDLDVLSAGIHFEGFDHALLTQVANPMLSLYWRLVRPLLLR